MTIMEHSKKAVLVGCKIADIVRWLTEEEKKQFYKWLKTVNRDYIS